MTDPEKCNEQRDLYPIQSRHKIERMNVKILTDEVEQQRMFISAWLKKI